MVRSSGGARPDNCQQGIHIAAAHRDDRQLCELTQPHVGDHPVAGAALLRIRVPHGLAHSLQQALESRPSPRVGKPLSDGGVRVRGVDSCITCDPYGSAEPDVAARGTHVDPVVDSFDAPGTVAHVEVREIGAGDAQSEVTCLTGGEESARRDGVSGRPRRRRCSRMAREEYALSARTTSGLVRGRPRARGTCRRAITAVKAGASPAWPAVRTIADGRQRPSAARWTFVVSPPRERPMAWSAGSLAAAPICGPRPRADARARSWNPPTRPSRAPRRRPPGP